MITHNLCGGLGNQLYQIMATISLAKKYHHRFYFTYKNYLGSTNETIRTTYWEALLNDSKGYTKMPEKRENKCKHILINEVGHEYNEIVLPTIEEEESESIINDENSISMHFRSGDYKNNLCFFLSL